MEATGAFCFSGAALGAALVSFFVQVSCRNQVADEEWRDDEGVLLDSEEDESDEERDEIDGKPMPTRRLRRAQKEQLPRKGMPLPDVIRRETAKDQAEYPADMNVCLGFSMQEAKEHAESKAKEAKDRSPMEVLHGLQKGNTRFWMGMPTKTTGNYFQRRALISMQYPSVAILGCSDSRVPTEIIFDQGLGDLFVVRVAGNCLLDKVTLASLQYAVCHLKVKVIVVLGHEGCGAVKAAGMPTEKIEQEPAALSSTLKGLKNGLDCDRLDRIGDHRVRDREAVVANVRAQIGCLSESSTLMNVIRRKELLVVGAFYEISSGIVDFFDNIVEVGDDGLELEEKEMLRQVSKTSFEVKSAKIDEVLMTSNSCYRL